jgi:putative colanic acid biosynthesis UDP-glucose lipid carrier transferase
VPTSWVGGVPCVRLLGRPLGGREAAVKAVSDRTVAAAALLAAAPLLALLALAVRLDSPGPVLYRQKRHGFNGRVIEVLKLRTMRAECCDDGTGTGDGAGVAQASRDDPRLTRVGRRIRRASLDELPQLVNVLRGEMSVVGPRPHAVAHNERFGRAIDRYAARHRVKPGITGWAQVNGLRGETDTVEKMARRVAYDLEYIENWSLALDARILLKTLLVGFVHPEAR